MNGRSSGDDSVTTQDADGLVADAARQRLAHRALANEGGPGEYGYPDRRERHRVGIERAEDRLELEPRKRAYERCSRMGVHDRLHVGPRTIDLAVDRQLGRGFVLAGSVEFAAVEADAADRLGLGEDQSRLLTAATTNQHALAGQARADVAGCLANEAEKR